MADRFETHLHTEFSNLRLLDAITKLQPTVDYALQIGLKGLCITDHGCVSGWIKANQIQQKLIAEGSDFKIGLGEEGYLVDTRENGIKYNHVIWYAKDPIGARQIRRMSSIANLNSYFDRGMERVPITKEEVEAIIGHEKGHIIVQTACLAGEVSANILEMESARKIGDTVTAEKAKLNIIKFILWAKELFGDDFYLEVAPAANKDQILVNKKMTELSYCFGVKMVLGCDAHYLKKEDRYVHEAFLNSRGGERETAQFYEYAYLQTEDEIKKNLTPSIVDLYDIMCENSMEIYNKIEVFSLAHSQQIPHIEVEDYPKKKSPLSEKYTILNQMFESDDKVNRYWINKCYDKLIEIGKNNETYLDVLEEEADIKRVVGEKLETNMYSYPVTLSKYIDLFWEMGSPVGVGRGSAGTGLNHYLLGITSLDPVQWKLDFWRYMNRDTEGLGDIDLDLAPSRLPAILQEIKRTRGMNFNPNLKLTEVEKENLGCAYVCTFGTESAKSAVQTAMRGYRSEEYPDGLDNDLSQYLSSLIPVERGFVRTLSDVFYGNKDKGYQPITAFVREVEKYPGLKEIMLGVEGMISRKGRHASGVLFLDEDPYQFGAYMKTPSGEVVTQWDLHDSEYSGSTKFDLLVTEVEDKILQSIKFLQADNEIESNLSIREVYNKYLHPDVLPLKDKEVWKAIQQASVLDLFQLDSSVGRQGAKKVKPENIIELSSVNGLIRLMSTEKGAETWLDKYVRFKNNTSLVENEMNKYNLTEDEKKTFNKYVEDTYGIGISQECIMKSLMDVDLCGFSLAEANKARKTISKKKMSEIPILKEKVFSRAKSSAIANYLWDYIVSPSLGYGFSDPHALAYSFIGFQTAYIATHWNPIYWNAACLVVNSGSLEDQSKEKTSDYAKIAKAIGAITSAGIEVSLVNINTSDFGFKPDVENNRILYGLKAISGINADTIDLIKSNRPYLGIRDFLTRCPLKKTVNINLIKAGAFDEIEKVLPNRKAIMAYYISQICDAKSKLTLQNFNGLIQHNLIPAGLEMQIRVFNFNKYLKTRKFNEYYTFDESCAQFFERFYSDYEDSLQVINGIEMIPQKIWDNIYKKEMDAAREWLKTNQQEVLSNYNSLLFQETWNKYAGGTIAHWEMESLCFYHDPHELSGINLTRYGVINFNSLSPDSEIDYIMRRAGKDIPIYKISRIAGTVLAKDDTRCTISLLTMDGVVSVKFTRDYYGMYKRQISEIQADGSKKVLEKGWFVRGTMLVVAGFRREDTFVSKTYNSTGFHQLYKIDKIEGDSLVLRHDRLSSSASFEEDEVDFN
jgi:DNA polymerase III subunit alpha